MSPLERAAPHAADVVVPSGDGRIRRRPDALGDQIAAGEGGERPASVVKELVENALDADARRLRIEVRDGGRALVAVADDGHGMTPAEARLSLERHATSKLGRLDDLSRIATFGFRGEALPAIASVSRLRLRTRARGMSEGTELVVDHGRAEGQRTAGGPEGTRIEVADLFQSIPARRKFLKTPGTEWGHVSDWLSRIALAHPPVHFELQRDARTPIAWPAVSDPLERIATVLSDEEAAALVAVEPTPGAIRIRGFASRPGYHRATGSGLHLFVNDRPVRDRLMRHAALEMYRDVLPRGRFPTLVLFAEVDAGAVDVNVHPAKLEVRFAEPREVHRAIRLALRSAIADRAWLGLTPSRPDARHAPATPRDTSWPRPAGERDGTVADASDWALARPTGAGALAPPAAAHRADPDTRPPTDRPIAFSEARCLGQVLGTYLVLETEEGLLLVDQHAAHERVLYESLRAEWLAHGVARQPLLIPASFELAPSAHAALAEAPATLERLGFEIEPFGADAVIVRAIPALLAGRDPVRVVRELADELEAAGRLDAAEPGADAGASRLFSDVDRLFAQLACHASRRAGQRLPPPEQTGLLAELDRIPWAQTCPHGRPVAIRLDRGELERRFSRR